MGDTPGTKAIDDFLNLRRPALTSDELQRAFREPCPAEKDPSYGFWDMLATTRVLDLWVAAGLWSAWGVSWSVLFTFYALVSTACAAMIFAISRRLSGSDWAGLASLVLFLASPLESYVGAWSIRDASPAWFAIASCWLLVCVVGQYQVQARECYELPGLGRNGYGRLWLAARFTVVVALLRARHDRDARSVAASVGRRLPLLWGCLDAGSLAISSGIQRLPIEHMPPGIGFHMAYYADYTHRTWRAWRTAFRSIAAMLKQCMPLARSRTMVRSAVEEPVEYLTPRYSAVCRELFVEQARYHAYDWIAAFPNFYWRCLGGFRRPIRSSGRRDLSLDSYRFAVLQPIYQGCSIHFRTAFHG